MSMQQRFEYFGHYELDTLDAALKNAYDYLRAGVLAPHSLVNDDNRRAGFQAQMRVIEKLREEAQAQMKEIELEWKEKSRGEGDETDSDDDHNPGNAD